MSILTWNDLYYQLWTQAAQSRGTVTSVGSPPAADVMMTMPEWPRTTGADVIAIATLVDPILGALPLRPGGYGTSRLWQSAVIELEMAAFASPAAEYPYNRSLWSALLAVASYLETMQASLPDEVTIDALLDTLWAPVAYRNAEPASRPITESNAEKMWTTQRDELAKLRGSDVRESPEIGGGPMKIPRSTNADIVRIADYWAMQLSTFLTKILLGSGPDNRSGLDGQLKRWGAIMEDVDKLARKGKPDDVYPKNHQLWHEAWGLAVNLATWGEVPSTFDLFWGATKQAVKDLPERLSDAAAAAAKAAGQVAHDIGAGFLSGLGKPLLIGGAAVVGLLVVISLTRHHEGGVTW
jgi:hypothetical protein